jgi:hypothetical protein
MPSASEALLEQAETYRVAYERAGRLDVLRTAVTLALHAAAVAEHDLARGPRPGQLRGQSALADASHQPARCA